MHIYDMSSGEKKLHRIADLKTGSCIKVIHSKQTMYILFLFQSHHNRRPIIIIIFEKKIIHTSRCIPSRLAVPPFAHSTGKCMALPESATALADCPLPITTTPANGRFSACWHNVSNTLTENL